MLGRRFAELARRGGDRELYGNPARFHHQPPDLKLCKTFELCKGWRVCRCRCRCRCCCFFFLLFFLAMITRRARWALASSQCLSSASHSFDIARKLHDSGTIKLRKSLLNLLEFPTSLLRNNGGHRGAGSAANEHELKPGLVSFNELKISCEFAACLLVHLARSSRICSSQASSPNPAERLSSPSPRPSSSEK